MHPDGTPDVGVELKGIFSMWSAIGVHFDLKPKSDNLIQAAHYSWALGKLPWWLIYSSRGEFHVSTAPRWLQDKFKPGPVYDVEYRDDGAPLKITPFNRVYDLTWNKDGHLYYQTDGLDTPVKTAITGEGIKAFYESLTEQRRDGTLGPRPTAKAVDGTKSYLACDYCLLKDTCDTYEKAPDEWRDRVQERVAELKKDPKFNP